VQVPGRQRALGDLFVRSLLALPEAEVQVMSQKTAIEWTDATWNPTRGCSRVSEGCRNCYAERIATRFSGDGMGFDGVATLKGWNGKVELRTEKLDEPFHWKKPRRVFVNSMSDLFHEKLGDGDIVSVFLAMAQCRRHTFQILTKRPAQMRDWFTYMTRPDWDGKPHPGPGLTGNEIARRYGTAWPLPNVWLGVSVEDQATADERIPLLLQTPAAVRFVSYEPALGPVDFERFLHCQDPGCIDDTSHVRLDWIIIGGESGPGARPMDLAWARSAVEQCKAAGVACFVKQLGAWPITECPAWDQVGEEEFAHRGNCDLCRDTGAIDYWFAGKPLSDRKGGDWQEWPTDLRVRQFPEART
jgi:protein gp37